MSEMVERVARAIATVSVMDNYGASEADATSWVGKNWREYVSAARAAIEAMREPTEEMVEAGSYPVMDGRENGGANQIASATYRAMVFAALEGK